MKKVKKETQLDKTPKYTVKEVAQIMKNLLILLGITIMKALFRLFQEHKVM